MSTKRYIDTKFWTDPFVMQLTPEQKVFYLYLFTNGDCNLAGVYETTVAKISFETGFSKDKVNEMLAFFEEQDKVIFVDNFILIKNFIKHQNVQNVKIRTGITKILDDLCMSHPCLIHDLSHLNLNLIKFNLNNNLNLNSSSDDSSEKTLTPPQKNYAKEIFDLWTAAKLPCAKDLLSFTSRDFKNSLEVIKPYHSNEVLEACRNYIDVLEDDNCWITYKYTFSTFAHSKHFSEFIPGNFRKENFYKWDKKDESAAPSESPALQTQVFHYVCPECSSKKMYIEGNSFVCPDCGRKFDLTEIEPEAADEGV